MRKMATGLVSCFLAAAGLRAQTPERATVILGAGRAGSWDTRISVTNADFNPIHVIFTAQPDRSSCSAAPCNDFAETTIPGHGTFVLESIPEPLQPGFSNAPQALYVLSPSDQNAPAVSAAAFDSASDCGRQTTLQVLALGDAFNPGDMFFPGIRRDGGSYANLIVTLDASAAARSFVGVGIVTPEGDLINAGDYDLDPGQTLLIQDVVGAFGIESLDGGAISLSKFFIPNRYEFTPFAATVMQVEPGRVATVTGARNRLQLQ
ncbi:MAG TPA: hypothetical protein VH854_05940 [Thermoanaerobaculia bacterium]|nr:hypothetical protein [Thermoanaerobaculia bacterium]